MVPPTRSLRRERSQLLKGQATVSKEPMETLESSETSTTAFCVSGARSENCHHEMPLFVFRDLLDAQSAHSSAPAFLASGGLLIFPALFVLTPFHLF